MAEYIPDAERAEMERLAAERKERIEAGRPWVAVGRINAALGILISMDVTTLLSEERALLAGTINAARELIDRLDGRLGDGQ